MRYVLISKIAEFVIHKGWFHFVYCMPELPEATEVMNGNMLFRVKPFNSRYQELAERYLTPISYQGNMMMVNIHLRVTIC